MEGRCQFWKDYESISGTVCYCELAAFNRPVNPDFLEKIGCTPEKRKECLGTMELNIGGGAVPMVTQPPVEQPAPVPVAAAPVVYCDPPPEVAKTVVGVAEKKAATALPSLALLAILAGAYIALGAVLFTIVTNDLATYIGDGLSRIIGGMSFSLGLILVILGGAELFTGNNLIVAGMLDKRVSPKQVLNNWFWVYLFNFVGALVVVTLFYYSGIWKANNSAIALRAVNIAYAKATLPWSEAFFRGILCNWLVCLAVWLSFAAKDAVSKIMGIMIPITAFVAAGFEHSIANMYFIPMGLILRGHEALQGLLNPAVAQGLTWQGFLFNNLVPVTIGNLIGGVIFVAVAYWSAYLRPLAVSRRMIANGKV
ncbi:MAG TPA: formate/nitrite transporter family protein [Bacillota bacterium]|nr:formate/nitrite transporter family protein [Bacillota bacterium]